MTYEQAIIYYKSLFVCYNPVTHGAKHSIIVINVCERLQYSWLVPVIPHPSPFNGCSYLSFNTFPFVVLSCMSNVHISPPSPPLFCDPQSLVKISGATQMGSLFAKRGQRSQEHAFSKPNGIRFCQGAKKNIWKLRESYMRLEKIA